MLSPTVFVSRSFDTVLFEFPISAHRTAFRECQRSDVTVACREIRALFADANMHLSKLVFNQLSSCRLLVESLRMPLSNYHFGASCRPVRPCSSYHSMPSLTANHRGTSPVHFGSW